MVLASEQQATEAEIQPQNLQIIPVGLEGTLAGVDIIMVKRVEIRVETTTPKGALVIEANVDVIHTSKAALIATSDQNQIQTS